MKGKGKNSVTVQLVSSVPSEVISALNRQGIPIMDLLWQDELTVQFSVLPKHLKQTKQITAHSGGRATVVADKGAPLWNRMLRRPVLLAGILLILFATFFLPSRILFVSVEGCSSIAARQVLAVAENYGVRFGASRQKLRSEQIKNALLSEIPKLQWVGVNTKGCVAYIHVKERHKPQLQSDTSGISSIVAAHNGVITELTLIRGTQVCKVGQAVKEGQLLVSGYSDCGICIHGTRAEAEVTAATHRDLTVITLSSSGKWVPNGASKQKISLIIGKKRINFLKDSGIYDTTCGKMYVEYYWTLPGGFRLPIGLAIETFTGREVLTSATEEQYTSAFLEEYAKQYLMEQMVAGSIQHSRVSADFSAEAPQLNGTFICTEMIGRSRNEEMHYE